MGSIQEQSGNDSDTVVRKTKLGGVKRLGSSLHHALNGLTHVWHTEQNFRIEIVCAIAAISLGLLLNINLVPIVLCCALVLSLELINTAIERLVDLTSPNYHPLAKQAKDIAAASVLLAAAMSVIVAVIIFVPAIIALF